MDAVLVPLLLTSLTFFLLTSLIALHNRRNFQGLHQINTCFPENDIKETKDSSPLSSLPLISILVPARNEEHNLSKLLKSLGKQDYPRLEIIIVDDQSEDNTRHVAEQFAQRTSIDVRVYPGKPKPDNWLGKNWACHQLSGYASGSILVFLDADTWLAPSTITRIFTAVNTYHLDFATVWPHQIMRTLVEKSVIATVYATIVLYLPTHYSFAAPRWIPFASLRQLVKPTFAAACGQCMIFTRQAYRDINGHESVKDQVIEDVALSKKIVRSGKSMKMFHGTDSLWCRMYKSTSDLYQGFRKNFFAGFGFHFPSFFAAWLLHILVFLLPPVSLLLLVSGIITTDNTGYVTGLAALATAIPFLQRFWITRFLKWPLVTALLHLPGVLWFQFLAIVVVGDRLFRRNISWKGRSV